MGLYTKPVPKPLFCWTHTKVYCVCWFFCPCNVQQNIFFHFLCSIADCFSVWQMAGSLSKLYYKIELLQVTPGLDQKFASQPAPVRPCDITCFHVMHWSTQNLESFHLKFQFNGIYRAGQKIQSLGEGWRHADAGSTLAAQLRRWPWVEYVAETLRAMVEILSCTAGWL